MSAGPMCVAMHIDINDTKLSEWRLRLSKIFLAGVEFQFLAAEKYLSCDLRILIPRRVTKRGQSMAFDKNLMSEGGETKKILIGLVKPAVQIKESDLSVLAATSFGLLSFRRETCAAGGLTTNRQVLLKSEVVLGNWLDKDKEKERPDQALNEEANKTEAMEKQTRMEKSRRVHGRDGDAGVRSKK